jgi:hypothetical protein
MSKIKSAMEDFNIDIDTHNREIIIGQYTFSASEVLEKMNPVAYNEEFSKWLDIMEQGNE